MTLMMMMMVLWWLGRGVRRGLGFKKTRGRDAGLPNDPGPVVMPRTRACGRWGGVVRMVGHMHCMMTCLKFSSSNKQRPRFRSSVRLSSSDWRLGQKFALHICMHDDSYQEPTPVGRRPHP